jgi:hypothetical protein
LRTLTIATLVVVLGLGPLAVTATASPFCFKDQSDRVYTLYVTGGSGPMVQVAGTEFTPPSGSTASITRVVTGAAYLAGAGFAVAAIMKFHQHKDNPTQVPLGSPLALTVIPAMISMQFAAPAFTSGVGTESSADGSLQASLTLTPAACVDPSQ